MTVIPILIGALCTVTKGLIQGLEDMEIRGRVKTIKTTALLGSATILRRVLDIWRDLWSLKLLLENISWRWCEKLKRVKKNNKASAGN